MHGPDITISTTSMRMLSLVFILPTTIFTLPRDSVDMVSKITNSLPNPGVYTSLQSHGELL
jgi:hypothetical protein